MKWMDFAWIIILVGTLTLAGCGDSSSEFSSDIESVSQPIFQNSNGHKPLFLPILDRRLRAAAGNVIITPDDENHPCEKYIGGTSQNRIATGAHDDLEARILVLTFNRQYLILVSLDLVGWLLSDVQKVMDELEKDGVDPDRIIISSTHTHEGPDTMGIWGPDYLTTGRCPEYIDFLVEGITNEIRQLAEELVPVTAYGAETEIVDPNSNYTNLQRDSRYPVVPNDHLTVARFEDDNGDTVATLVNWHSHPEAHISAHEYSSDFCHWTRLRMEEEYGGTCVYISGTVGGLLTPLGVNVPQRTESGEPVFSGEQPVYIGSGGWTKVWSLGYVIAEWAIAALEEETLIGDVLRIDTVEIEIPVVNPAHVLAMLIGLVEKPDNFIHDHPAYCGWFGCFAQTIHHVEIGSLHMFSLPGEAFSETSVGRDEYVKDWGSTWGEHVYPAIVGYRELLPEGDLVMDIGLANNEIGYIVPHDDFEPIDHPNFYEEIYFFSLRTETIIREAIYGMIQDK